MVRAFADRLPIDDILPELDAALSLQPNLVLVAPVDEGVLEGNIRACSSCHGADAKGADGIRRLAGPLFDDTTRKLTNWSQKWGQDPAEPDASQIMEPIAHGLTPRQVLAVVADLGSLKKPSRSL